MRRAERVQSPRLWVGPIVLDRTAIYSLALAVMAVTSVLPQSRLRAIEVGKVPGSFARASIGISHVVSLHVYPADEVIRISWRRGDSEQQNVAIEDLKSLLVDEDRKADGILTLVSIDRNVSYDHVVRIIDIFREARLPFRLDPPGSLSSFGFLQAF